MPPFFTPTSSPLPAGPPERTKERVYVICQLGSWFMMLAMQVFFALAFNPNRPPAEMVQGFSIATMVVALGLLISHFTRRLVQRWGWKELGWKALAPRIVAIAIAQSCVWTAVGYAYPYLVLNLQRPAGSSLLPFMAMSLVNGTVIFIGWWCVYFFYHLFDRFNRLKIEQLRLATEVKEAELRALKSQVNPHFIFNALNSLRALIDEDPSRARMAVTQLANLLRYSLQSAQAESVSFEEELRVVNDYLALEQVRHEERLRVRLDIDPDTLTLPVPPLILQTLVENAVKYGISPRPEGGEITITARIAEGRLQLRVTNPGELPATRTDSPLNGSTGLGLKNAAERLRLSFGHRARLSVKAEAPALVVAEVLVPTPSTQS